MFETKQVCYIEDERLGPVGARIDMDQFMDTCRDVLNLRRDDIFLFFMDDKLVLIIDTKENILGSVRTVRYGTIVMEGSDRIVAMVEIDEE